MHKNNVPMNSKYLQEANQEVRSVMCAQITNFSGCPIRTQLWLAGADHKKLLKLYNNFFSDQTCL